MPARPARAELASHVWLSLYGLVGREDRHQALRDELDLGPGRVSLLVTLRDQGPRTLREIAAWLGVEPSSATVAVDAFEARGLVRRAPHPEDNRRKLVHITQQGRTLAARGERILAAAPASFDALSVAELQTLGELIGRLAP